MPNNIDNQLENIQMYQNFSELPDEQLKEIQEEIKEYVEEDNIYDKIKQMIEKIEKERLKEIFYWRLYYLLDNEDNLTDLGNYYELLYTHHYLKALKLFISLPNSIQKKNEIFSKNEKAKEYLKHFEYFVKKRKWLKWIK